MDVKKYHDGKTRKEGNVLHVLSKLSISIISLLNSYSSSFCKGTCLSSGILNMSIYHTINSLIRLVLVYEESHFSQTLKFQCLLFL